MSSVVCEIDIHTLITLTLTQTSPSHTSTIISISQDVIGGMRNRNRSFDGGGGTKLRRAQRRKAKAVHDGREEGVPLLPPAGPTGLPSDRGQGQRGVPEVGLSIMAVFGVDINNKDSISIGP